MFKIEDEQDKNARQVMDLRYMKLLRNILGIVCSWPHSILGSKYKSHFYRNTITIFCEGIFVAASGILYVRRNFKTVPFVDMGQTYLTIFISILVSQRVTISWFKSYHILMKQFLLEIHLFYHKDKTEYLRHIHHKVHKICHVFAALIVGDLFIGIFLFNATPIFNNFSKGMFSRERPEGELFDHAICYILPFIDQFRDLKAYIFIVFVNFLFSFDAGMNCCAFDVTLSIIVFHIWGHLKSLEYDLRHIPTPTEMRAHQPTDSSELIYTEEENKIVAATLKGIVNHHRMIMNFMNKTSDAFGPMLCLYYIFHQVSGCILLLECAQFDSQSLIRYGVMTLTMMQFLMQTSVIIELLGTQSEKLIDAVYSVPWECMDESNRKIVLFLFCNVQTPISLKPLGLVSVGVKTMATILKTSFSYFMLLRTFT